MALGICYTDIDKENRDRSGFMVGNKYNEVYMVQADGKPLFTNKKLKKH